MGLVSLAAKEITCDMPKTYPELQQDRSFGETCYMLKLSMNRLSENVGIPKGSVLALLFYSVSLIDFSTPIISVSTKLPSPALS